MKLFGGVLAWVLVAVFAFGYSAEGSSTGSNTQHVIGAIIGVIAILGAVVYFIAGAVSLGVRHAMEHKDEPRD